MFQSDRPIENEQQDRLHRAKFSSAMADALMSYQNPDGLVVGLYGSWGAGKSSVLNLMKAQLTNVSEPNTPVIMDFQPWLISHREALIAEFFDQLAGLLGRRDLSGSLKAAGKKLKTYGILVSQFSGIPHFAVAASGLAIAGTMASGIGDVMSKSLIDLKHDIERDLKGQSRKIIVIVDDLDRLMPDEIRTMMRLVKAIADFPNVIYVLSMDPNIVSTALGNGPHETGEAFLAKIVQVPVSLPAYSLSDQNTILLEGIISLIPNIGEEKWGGVLYWSKIQFDGRFLNFFSTIREVHRFLNVLAFEYGQMRGEVNPIDLVALTVLKVLVPTIYQILRDNKELFTGKITDKDDQHHFNELLEICSQSYRPDVEAMLAQLFPRFMVAYHPQYSSPDNGRLRVSDSNSFDRYFSLEVPSGDISESHYSGLLKALDSPGDFSQTILKLKEEGRWERFLQMVLESIESQPKSMRDLPIVDALFDVSDDMVELNPFSGSNLFILRIVYRYLAQNFDQHERFDVLEHAINHSRSTYIPALNVAVLGQQHGKFGSSEAMTTSMQTVNNTELSKLELKMSEKLRAAKISIESELWPWILPWWTNWDRDREQEFVQKTTTTENLTKVVNQFLTPYITEGILPGLSEQQWRLGCTMLLNVFGKSFMQDLLKTYFETVPVQEQSTLLRRLLEFIQNESD